MAKFTSAFAVLLHFELVRSLILLQGPASLTIGSDRLQIVCSPSNGTENWSINIIQLFSNKSDILGSPGSKLVSMYYDIASREGKISWQDATLQSRATAFGNIDTPSTANLTLIIEGESTQCLDAASYMCEISAIESGSITSETSEDLFIAPFANPDQIENIKETLSDGYHDGNGRFDYGTSLELFCNATVGIPQQSTQWCVKYSNETSFRVYPHIDDVTHNPAFQESRCQYRQDSILRYNVSDTDTVTNFLCEVTENSSECQSGVIKSNFSVEVVYARVDIAATPEINIYKSPIEMNCSQATSGKGLTTINMMQLYKTFATGNKSLIFSVIFDAIYNQSQIDWSDLDIRNRANLSSDITSVSSANFRFNIPAKKTLCEDEAMYTCILTATNVKGENISDSKDIYIKTNALPAGLDTINVTADNKEIIRTGTVALGTQILLFCNGLVGSPSQNLTWCIKRIGDTDYKAYNDVTQSEAILAQDCQHQRNSTLVYNVTSVDASTMFLCEAGRRNGVCGSGYANSSFTVYAVDIDVSITAPETVTSRQGDLKIDCQQSASGQGEFYKTELSIYRYISTNVSLENKIVSIRHNGSTNSSFVIWHDEETRQRGEAKGVVYETKSAFLSLTLNGSSVTCLDESWYKCEMKVSDIFDDQLVRYDESFVNIKVIPDHMLNIKGTAGHQTVTTEGAFESESTIELTCNSTVGDPPEDLFWCIKQYNDTDFSLYSSTSNKSQSPPSKDGPCQFRRTSTLLYNVTKQDRHTTLMCTAGSSVSCEQGFVNSTFKIYVVDTILTITTTDNTTLGEDDFVVTCNQTGSQNGLQYPTAIHLSKLNDTSNSSISVPLLSFTHNTTTSLNQINWYDQSLAQRSSVIGDATGYPAFLKLIINENNTKCEDRGTYVCTLNIMDVTGSLVNRTAQDDVNIKTLPRDMQAITARSEDGESSKMGAFQPGTLVYLSCTSKVGDPPQNLTWCLKRENDNNPSEHFDSVNINQTEPVSVGSCQFQRTSFLLYNVTSKDNQTVFSCQAGVNASCGTGYVQTFFNLYAVDAALSLDIPQTLIPGHTELTVICRQTGSVGGIQYISSAHVYKDTDGQLGSESSKIVTVTYDHTSGSTQYNWHDVSVQSRAKVTEHISSPPGKLTLHIDANVTICEDAANYRCEFHVVDVSGRNLSLLGDGIVSVKNIPENFKEIAGTDGKKTLANTGTFESGSLLKLTCSANVGLPPMELTWCMKKENQTNFIPFPNETQIIQSGAIATSSCQFSRISILSYRVSHYDRETQFMCVAQTNATCDAKYGKAEYTLYAVDTALTLDIPQTLIPGQNELILMCRQTGSVAGIQYISSAQIYKDTNGQLGSESSKLVTVTYDQTSGATQYNWHDVSVQSRAKLSGNISSLPGTLTLHIEANVTVCEDAAQYRCEFHVVGVSGHNLSLTADGTVSIKNIPGNFKEIAGTNGNKTSANTGTFESGSLLKLSCSANVGLPPMDLTWCMKQENQTNFVPFPNETQIAQSGAIATSSCQFSRISVLSYHVSHYDRETQFMCVAQTNATCDAKYGKAEYTLYAVDTALTLDIPQTLIPGHNAFTLMCKQTGSVAGIQYISSAQLYKDINGQLGSESSKIVTVTYDQTSGSTQYNWHDVTVQSRAKLSENISSLPGKLTLHIDANLTVCGDAANFRCEFHVVDVSGHNLSLTADGTVSVKNIPWDFKEIIGTVGNKASANIGAFESGSLLKLSCSANVGLPPMELTWCMKELNETNFIPFPNETQIAQSEAIATSSCQFRRISILSYYVSNNDNGTQFMCVVQTNATCGVTYGQATYALYAVDVDVETVLPTSMILGKDSLEIKCRQLGMGYGLLAVKSLSLSRKPKDNSNSNWTEILSLEHDKSLNLMIYRWNDMDLKRRATVSGRLLHPHAFLHLDIPRNSTRCEDDLKYGCHLEALDLTNDTLERFRDNGFNLISPPNWMNPVIENTSNRSKPGIGIFKPGDIISLLCNSSVGDPPQNISWSFKRENELFYNKLDSIQSDPVHSDSCQNFRFSYLSYNVSDLDTETSVVCLIGNDRENGGLNNSFIVYTLAVDVNIEVPPKIEIKRDKMETSCLQQGTGRGLTQMESKLTIYKDTNGELGTNQSRIVSVHYDFSSQSSVIAWHDSIMRHRASASGEINRNVSMSTYLTLTLDANSTDCNDSATYRCELNVPDVTGTLVVRYKDRFVDKEYIPDYIGDITGLFENRTTVSIGVYKPEDTILLACQATAGYPPMNITWCAKVQHDTHFSPIQNKNLNNLEDGSSDSCENMQTSTLTYNVTSNETETQILCKVGRNTDCSSHILNSSFALYTVDSDIIISSPDKFVLGIEKLEVNCQESGTGRAVVRMSSKIHLMKRSNTTGATNPLVTVEYDMFSRSSIIKWHDMTLKDRAFASGEITLNSLKQSYLLLEIDYNSTKCEDATYYICRLEAPDYSGGIVERLSGKTVDIEVLPDVIENIQVHTTNWLPLLQRSFEIGSQVQLTCTGTVGFPAREIHWCIKRKHDPDFKSYPNTGITQSNPELENGCQYRRSSTLQFNISSQDEETEFLCKAINSTDYCGEGHLNSTVTLYAIDVEFFINITTKNVTLLQDRIEVTCLQNRLGVGLTAINYIYLYRDTVQIVSVERGNITVWYDTSVQSRASVVADVTSVQGAYLTFEVLPLSTTCADAGTYKCLLSAIDASNQLFISEKETTVEIFSLPDTLNINLRTSSGSSISGSTAIVGATLLITCSGSVGKPAMDIEWCIKTSNDSFFVPYLNSSYITVHPPYAGPSSDCEFEGSSVLEMTIPNSFLNLQVSIMCETGRSACGTGLSSASLTFTVVTEGDASEFSTETSGISPGAMTGIAIGILAAIVGPSVVLLIWKRKCVRHFLRSKVGEPGYRVGPEKTGNIENTNLNRKALPPISKNLANGKSR